MTFIGAASHEASRSPASRRGFDFAHLRNNSPPFANPTSACTIRAKWYTGPHMLVYKCDACKKPIRDSKWDSAFMVGFGLARNHLCKQCAAPIIRVLERYKLIDQKA